MQRLTTSKYNRKEIYIDAEWFITQKMYLIGYAYSLSQYGQLYGKGLTAANVRKILKGVERIYFYGPDVGMLEKCFGLKLREKYRCVNILRAMRRLYPRCKHFRLCNFEKRMGIKRQTMEYKSDIWSLHRDWADPKKRECALLYNMEDVLNLIRVKRYYWEKHRITDKAEKEFAL